MKMVCPECGHTEDMKALPMRLQTCNECEVRGKDAYLSAPSMELRMPAPPHRFARNARDEARKLDEAATLASG